MRRNGCGLSAGGPQGRQPQAHCRIDRRRGASLVSCFLFFAGSGARSGRNTKEAFPTETWRRRGGPRSSGSTDSLTGAVCSDDHKAPGFRKATACPAFSQGGTKLLHNRQAKRKRTGRAASGWPAARSLALLLGGHIIQGNREQTRREGVSGPHTVCDLARRAETRP